jgi:hypothetical protein
MKKNKAQIQNPNYFFPGDSEEMPMPGPCDSVEQEQDIKPNNNIISKDYNKYNKNNISNTKYNFQDSEDDYFGVNNNINKFKDSYKPKNRETKNENDDDLEQMLNQTKNKQKENNKLKEKSIIINESQFQKSKDNKDSISINKSNDRYHNVNSNELSASNLDTVNINMKSGLSNTQRSNFSNYNNIDINNESMNLSSTRHKVPKKNNQLNKEEIEQIEQTNFNNFADDIIESFFEKNNSDSPNFYFDLANEMQKGQLKINYKLKKMIEDDEINNNKLNQKKQEYIVKLENIKKKNS